MAADLARRLADGERLLLDGGIGSRLIAMGLEQGQAPERWVLEHPDRVEQVHREYVEAGSDAIHTCSFGGSPPKLASAGLQGRCEQVNLEAARIARRAAGAAALVAGDVGPTGLMFPPMGDAAIDQLRDAFRRQVEALARGGVDLISIETMFDLREALAALEAALETGLPVLASMTFEAKKRGVFTIMGDALVPSLEALASAGAVAVGLNCSVDPAAMIPMVEQAAAAVGAPLVAQPNAGQPQVTAGGVFYDAQPEPFAAALVQMVRLGARIVGGCCGTDASFIRAARIALDGEPAPSDQE